MKTPRDYTDEELVDFYPRIVNAVKFDKDKVYGSTTLYCADIREEILRRMENNKE